MACPGPWRRVVAFAALLAVCAGPLPAGLLASSASGRPVEPQRLLASSPLASVDLASPRIDGPIDSLRFLVAAQPTVTLLEPTGALHAAPEPWPSRRPFAVPLISPRPPPASERR